MSALPKVSVVIPSWNGAKFVAECLPYLLALEGEAPEILVVDHGRLNRDTETLLQKFTSYPNVRYVGRDQQLGYAGAVNCGVREASHDLVAVICNDVLVDKKWLLNLLAEHQKLAERGKNPIVFSAVHREELPDPRLARTNLWFRAVRPEGAAPTTQFFHPDGSAFLFSRAAYGEPFDSEYFLYQEDVYLGWRAQLRGEPVVLLTSSTARNVDGGTTRRTPYRTSFLTERNRWLNYLSFFSASTLCKAMPILLLDLWLKILAGKNRWAKAHAIFWLVFHPGTILRKRRLVQRERKVSDDEILPFLSATYLEAPAAHPLNRAFASMAKMAGLKLSP